MRTGSALYTQSQSFTNEMDLLFSKNELVARFSTEAYPFGINSDNFLVLGIPEIQNEYENYLSAFDFFTDEIIDSFLTSAQVEAMKSFFLNNGIHGLCIIAESE